MRDENNKPGLDNTRVCLYYRAIAERLGCVKNTGSLKDSRDDKFRQRGAPDIESFPMDLQFLVDSNPDREETIVHVGKRSSL